MKWKQQLLGLKAYQPGRTIEEVKKQFNLNHIVKLASNENPFGSSPKVLEALKKSMALMHCIPMDMQQTSAMH